MVFDDLPEQFRQAYDYVRALGFDETPDYELIKRLFLSILELHHNSFNVTKPCTKRPFIVTPREIADLFEEH